MRSSVLMLAATAAVSGAVKPETPDAWRAAAAQDLTAIHDTLRDNSPAMIVKRDSALFRRWIDEGLRQARADLPKVMDGHGYYYVIQGYVGGFRDSHIQWGPNRASGISLRAFSWPGFVLGYRNGGYEVAFRAPDALEAPPAGARLIGCDGKPAEALAQAHDRYDGNFQLESVRHSRAVSLLLERGNPFVSHPNTCSFRVEGRARDYRLTWRPLDQAQTAQIDAAIGGGVPSKLGLEPWGDRRWWISVPSMGGDQDWSGFYASVRTHLDGLRSADVVVIDVRGNGGGDSSYADRLARLLWGEAFVDAHQPRLGPTVWRASKLNRDYWATLVDKISKDPDYPPDGREEFRRILARYDQALAHGDPSFTLDDEANGKRPPSGPNPVHGRVVLLTDYACNSACLDLMDEFMAMPNVVQAGTVTSADTIFMELTIVPELPSGLGGFAFGHKAWIKRPRGSNVPYTPAPHLTWTGAPKDDAGLRLWLEKALAGS